MSDISKQDMERDVFVINLSLGEVSNAKFNALELIDAIYEFKGVIFCTILQKIFPPTEIEIIIRKDPELILNEALGLIEPVVKDVLSADDVFDGLLSIGLFDNTVNNCGSCSFDCLMCNDGCSEG